MRCGRAVFACHEVRRRCNLRGAVIEAHVVNADREMVVFERLPTGGFSVLPSSFPRKIRKTSSGNSGFETGAGWPSGQLGVAAVPGGQALAKDENRSCDLQFSGYSESRED